MSKAWIVGIVMLVASEARAQPQLRWIDRGARLVVDDRWVLDPESGAFTPARYPEGPSPTLFARSPSGEREAVLLGEDSVTFRHGPAGGPFGAEVKVPRLLSRKRAPDGTRRIAFWVSERVLVIREASAPHEEAFACRAYDVVTRGWSPAACPEGDFNLVWNVEPGPNGWLAIHSAGEGHPGVLFARYDVKRGQGKPEGPSIDEYPSGPVEATFTQDGKGLLLATPCLLERQEPRPCEDLTDDKAPWRIYAWTFAERKLVLLREGLPEPIVPSPKGHLFAWPEPSRVCVAPLLDKAAEPRCFPLPRR